MSAQPALAESYRVSEDGKTYTFQIRKDAMWSDGVPITSHDFKWSWTRMLHAETLCQYSALLFGLPHAEAFKTGEVKRGDRVEVEQWDRPDDVAGGDSSIQNFPRGTLVYGTLKEILKPPKPDLNKLSDDQKAKKLARWKEDWVFLVEECRVDESGLPQWDNTLETQSYCRHADSSVAANSQTIQAHGVLVAFDQLGAMETPDDHTFVVKLTTPIPYFLDLLANYPTFVVPRHVINKHGSPLWTKDQNIVACGPYRIAKRLLRDRVRLVKNERYFDAANVAIETIDAMSLESGNTALNMYETGQLDWVTEPPSLLLKELKKRDDFYPAPMLSIYFYRINTTRPPLNDVRVRRAIAMAINRTQIVERITKAGQIPAYTSVPPGIAGYQSPPGFEPDIEEAKRLLAEADFPGGLGFPKQTLLYNTQAMHRAIAEVVQQQLLNSLNIKIELQNMEWGSYLSKVDQLNYDIARAGWVADYSDPTTFLDLWTSDSPLNGTGWKNDRYDELMKLATQSGGDADQRMKYLAQAEAIWIEELPAIPMYFYVSKNMVKSKVKGFVPTPQDRHPLHLLRIKEEAQ